MNRVAKLFLWTDKVFYLGPNFETDLHSHHAVQISIGLQRTLEVSTDHNEVGINNRIIITASDIRHRFSSKEQNVALIFLPKETEGANSIDSAISDESSVIGFPDTALGHLLPDLQAFHDHSFNCQKAERMCCEIIKCMQFKSFPKKILDERILYALRILENHSSQSVTVSDLAKTVGLSTSRFCHLAKQQIGIPIRTFYLWKKMIRAIAAIENVGSLTEAAHVSGFSDSSHMSRTFRRMFGLKPSFLIKKKNNLKMFQCDQLGEIANSFK